jgi:hypothetical protein
MRIMGATPLFLLVMLASVTAESGVPDIVTYSGRLSDGTGWGQSLTVSLEFRIYDAEVDGNLLWKSAFSAVAIEDGYFSVMLSQGTGPDGQPTDVSQIFLEHDATWLTVLIDSGLELVPRQTIGSVPYAIRGAQTDNASTIEGLNLAQLDERYVKENQENSISSSMIQDNTITDEKVNGGGNVPFGAIMMFAGDCPDGWSRVEALDNRFPMGGENYGETGGTKEVSIDHGHSTWIYRLGNSLYFANWNHNAAPSLHYYMKFVADVGGQSMTPPTDQNSGYIITGPVLGGPNKINITPEYLKVVYCQKD